MQSDIVSYQRTICGIESIIYFDTAAAAVHHLKAEKVRCEQRGYVPNMHTFGHLRALSPSAAGVADVAALVSLSLLFALLVVYAERPLARQHAFPRPINTNRLE